jgi:hypothetical protein
MADVRELAAQAVEAVRRHVEGALAKVTARLDDLATRTAAVEGKWEREYSDRIHRANVPQTPERGEKGEPGQRGEQGEPGQRGEQGEPGRDALELEVLNGIDPSKAYPRGVFATHHGGLVRSVRRTDPLRDDLAEAGWQVVVDGLREVTVEPRGERGFVISIAKTSGAVKVAESRMNVVLDRGVFREGSPYERGDGITFGGSYWIAQKDAPEGKPGMSADWRLAVKKGRDGKDWSKP